MAIQYTASFYYNASVTGGTRALLADAVKDAMVAAGWTLNRTAAANDYFLESGVAANSLQIRARVYDPGSGNCARVYLLNTAETINCSASPVFLLPGTTYIFSGNAFQCLMQQSVWTGVSRTFGFWGVGYTESFNTATALGLQMCNGADAGGSIQTSFQEARTAVLFGTISNGSAIATNTSGNGIPRLGLYTLITGVATTWAADNSLHVYEPLVAWSAISGSDSTDLRVRMQLYDAMIVAGAWNAGTDITWDSKTWRAVTHQNTSDYMTLFVRKT
jgi:hypothetical protein